MRRVINGIQAGECRHLFDPDNVWTSAHGGGAGNNWASGYHQAQVADEDIADMIRELSFIQRHPSVKKNSDGGASSMTGSSG